MQIEIEDYQYRNFRLMYAISHEGEGTPLGVCEWAWQTNLITFPEMLAIIEWLRETGQLESEA